MNIEKVKKLRKGKIHRIKEMWFTGPHLLYNAVDPDTLLGEIKNQDMILFLNWYLDSAYVWCQVIKGDVIGWFRADGMELLEEVEEP